jgi:hypothetical protein
VTKDEAQAEIDRLISESRQKIRDAMKIADEHGLNFSYEPQHIGDYYGKGDTKYYGDPDEPLEEGRWVPSSWSSSSIYC